MMLSDEDSLFAVLHNYLHLFSLAKQKLNYLNIKCIRKFRCKKLFYTLHILEWFVKCWEKWRLLVKKRGEEDEWKSGVMKLIGERWKKLTE
jgi:hypothetical protein